VETKRINQMSRPLFIALVAVLASANLNGQEAKPSPKVKAVLDDTARKVRANLQGFNKANEKPLAEARKELEAWAKKLIEDGKPDEAGAVLKHVKTLDADVMRMANAPVPLAAPGVGDRRATEERHQAVKKKLVDTRWVHLDIWNYRFSPDGRFVLEGTPRQGTFALTEDARNIVLRWRGEGRIDVWAVGDGADDWMAGDGTHIRPAGAIQQ
jgi:hypothetical protein